MIKAPKLPRIPHDYEAGWLYSKLVSQHIAFLYDDPRMIWQSDTDNVIQSIRTEFVLMGIFSYDDQIEKHLRRTYNARN